MNGHFIDPQTILSALLGVAFSVGLIAGAMLERLL